MIFPVRSALVNLMSKNRPFVASGITVDFMYHIPQVSKSCLTLVLVEQHVFIEPSTKPWYLFFSETRHTLFITAFGCHELHWTIPASVTGDTFSHMLFTILDANISKKLINLPDDMLVAVWTELPEMFFPFHSTPFSLKEKRRKILPEYHQS